MAPTAASPEPPGPPAYEAATFRASFPEAAAELFISSEGSRGELIPEHVEAFLGVSVEDATSFRAVAVVPFGEQEVFILRQEGGGGPADHIAVVGSDGEAQSLTTARFGQKSWLEEGGVLRIQTSSYPDGASAAVLTQRYYALDSNEGYVLRP